ncbi:MAG: DUF2189 domain-containing protein [Hyphomicrobiaceae bacterium]
MEREVASKSGTQWPEVRSLGSSDLIDALATGLRDLRSAPQFGLTFGLAYAAAGWLLIALLLWLGLPYFAYPLAMGFTLVAPFAVAGLYAVSDLLERGEKPSWRRIAALVRTASGRDLRWMALITGFALVIWMDIAAFTFFAFNGFNAFDPEVLKTLFTTPSGLAFVILGNAIGAAVAAAVFSISVVSFPMLYDRDVDFVTAMVTSVRLVIRNPATMLAWAALIGVLIVLSLLSVFVALIPVLPMVGHATWHLYRRAVVRT